MQHQVQPFVYYNPVRLWVGSDQINRLRDEVPRGTRVLLLYGAGSIKRNGIYDRVREALNGCEIIEQGGVQPNPVYEDLLPVVERIKAEQAELILAVGGGSVIDAAKFLSVAPFLDNPWEHMVQNLPYLGAIPLGTVLTLPATGSEMNGSFVITRRSDCDKHAFVTPPVYPKFSIMEPAVVATLPERQRVNGVVDAFTHVLEQYLTYPVGGILQDELAEAVLRSLLAVGPSICGCGEDYDEDRVLQFMLCTSFALNGMLRMGTPEDWSTHIIGHELTARFGLDHAQTLAVVLPALLTHQLEQKQAKLARYAGAIWGERDGDESVRAEFAVEQTRLFFERLGAKVRLRDYGISEEALAEVVSGLCSRPGWSPLGERADIDQKALSSILRLCY